MFLTCKISHAQAMTKGVQVPLKQKVFLLEENDILFKLCKLKVALTFTSSGCFAYI